MNTSIDITDLCIMAGIEHKGRVQITHEDMSGLEPHPKNDWLYLGLLSLKEIAKREGVFIRSSAFIGSGNGIETIAALKLFPNLETIFITDLVKNIQPAIIKNITANANKELKGIRTYCLEGRDCSPLSEPVDLIYGNLPLIMIDQREIEKHRLSLTTLTDEQMYMHLSQGPYDMLTRWSLLSQLGFLLSAKEKLAPGGSILTFIGGRISYYALEQCFRRAGGGYRKIFTSFKRQRDGQFFQQYAEYETKEGVDFAFYDYKEAVEILRQKLGIIAPEIIVDIEDADLKILLAPTLISANKAYENYQKGMSVGHIAHAFEAWND